MPVVDQLGFGVHQATVEVVNPRRDSNDGYMAWCQQADASSIPFHLAVADNVKGSLTYDFGGSTGSGSLSVDKVVNGSILTLKGTYKQKDDAFILEETVSPGCCPCRAAGWLDCGCLDSL